MPLISVIIPVYNRAFIIKDCINAIVQQSFTDFELILINDGSSDATLSIIESFPDKRIKCITQPNAGVSAARNKGLEMASGKWICFIDSDDVIKPDYLLSFVQEGIKQADASLYIQNIRVIRNQVNIDVSQECWLLYDKQPFGKVLSFSEYMEAIDITRVAHPFPKLFRHDVIQKSNLRFNTDYHNAEDCLFLAEFLAIQGIIYCIDVKQYYYQKNDTDTQALSNSQSTGKISGKELIKVFCDIFTVSYPQAFSPAAKKELVRSIQSRIIDAIVYSYRFGHLGSSSSLRIEFLKQLSHMPVLQPLFQQVYHVDYKSKKMRFLEYLLFTNKFIFLDTILQIWKLF